MSAFFLFLVVGEGVVMEFKLVIKNNAKVVVVSISIFIQLRLDSKDHCGGLRQSE